MSGSDTRNEALTIGRLAAPIALAQFGVNAINLVDVAVLGHASARDLGGAAIGRSINFAAVALGFGVSVAIEPLAAQALGANDARAAWRALLAALIGCVIVWAPTAVLGWAATSLLVPLGIPADLAAAAREFVVPQIPGMLAFTFFLTIKSFLQAHERTTPSLIASVIANVVNVIVCNLLVRGDEALVAIGLSPWGLPARGAFGAGVASSIAMVVLMLGVAIPAFRMRPSDAKGELPVRKVLTLGTPMGLQLLVEIAVFSLAGVLAGKLGDVVVSAHQIALGLASFTFMGALGISGATAVRVGHSIGEGRSPRRAGLVGIALGAVFMTLSAIVFLSARRWLIGLFTTDASVIDLGATLLIVAAAFQAFDGVQVVAAGALRGAADVRFSFLANIGAHWVIGFPLALALAFGLGLGALGLWFGLLAGLVVVSVLLLWRWSRIAKQPIARV